MQILKQSTAVDVVLGAFIDDTDGKTAETGLTISQADCQLTKNGGTAAQKNDANAATHLANGHYKIPLNATDTNTCGQLRVMINESGALPVWAEFQIVEEVVYDALFAASATGLLPANVTQISGDSTAADNCEAFFDGTGYAGTNNTIPTVTTITNDVGVNEWNGVALGTTNPLPNAAAGAAGGLPTDSTGKTSFNDITTAQVNTEADTALSDFFTSAAQLVDDIWDEVLTSGSHNVQNSAGRRLRNIQDFGIYDLASVWVDEVGGTSTGTVDGEDATVTNRADDFDNAQTVAASVGLDRIHVQNGNSITLTATLNGYNVWGENYTVALGSQDIGNTTFTNATISGTGTGTTPAFEGCVIGTAALPPAQFRHCRLTTTLTIGSAGNFQFHDCASGVAGASSPTVDLGGAVGATNIEFRRWSGGLTLSNVQAGDVVSVDCVSGGTISINGSGGDVHVRGMVAVNDLSGGSVTITQTQAINRDYINAEVDTALSDYDPPTKAELDSGLAALNDVSTAEVNAEVVDALSTDTYAEPGQGAPGATISLADKIGYLYKVWRNKSDQNSTTTNYYADDGSTVDHKSTISDNGTTATRGEVASGP